MPHMKTRVMLCVNSLEPAMVDSQTHFKHEAIRVPLRGLEISKLGHCPSQLPHFLMNSSDFKHSVRKSHSLRKNQNHKKEKISYLF